jgi:hypothetical protein
LSRKLGVPVSNQKFLNSPPDSKNFPMDTEIYISSHFL